MNLKLKLEEYKSWAKTQKWYDLSMESSIVVFKSKPDSIEINLLEDKFGKLPTSYLKTLDEFGLSEFIYENYLTKMLSPKEIIEAYEIVQNEMDFADGLREELLEEDDFDFSKYIPVMAGKGTDGCWILLDIDTNSKGEVLYWDTDQPGYIEMRYKNIEDFVLKAINKAMKKKPIRLT